MITAWALIGPEVFIVQPGFVQGLVQRIGFTEQGAGYTASVEDTGIAAITVASAFLANRIDWRKLLYVSLLVMFGANVASAYVHDLSMSVRCALLAEYPDADLLISFTAIGLTRKVDRNFGLLIMWVLLYGAFGLLAMPAAFRAVGMSGVLWFFALFPLLESLLYGILRPARAHCRDPRRRGRAERAAQILGAALHLHVFLGAGRGVGLSFLSVTMPA